MTDTQKDNVDTEHLAEATQSTGVLRSVAQLLKFQSAMCRDSSGKLEWHNLVSEQIRNELSEQEIKLQSVIFDFIKEEMEYVRDLESIDALFIQPLLHDDPPPIPRDRVEHWISAVFSNFADVQVHHRRMVDRLHEIQREEHPIIRSIMPPVFNAALNWQGAYRSYLLHYPIAEYFVDEEKANSEEFRVFVEQQSRAPDAHDLELKAFIHRPVARLPRYQLLLRGIMAVSPIDHEDQTSLPQIIEIISELNLSMNAGIGNAKQKVEIWNYENNLVWKPGEMIDLDLHNEARRLYYSGKLYRQPEGELDFSKWGEVFVLLFDNYLVVAEPRTQGSVTKYHVNQRPILIDLMNLVGFADPPQQQITRRFGFVTKQSARTGGSIDSTQGTPLIYSFGIHSVGRAGGISQFFVHSATARTEWRQKLEEAMEMRKVMQDSSQVFELGTLSDETFAQPNKYLPSSGWNEGMAMADRRQLVAIGCAEGVWIGLQYDPKSIRRVLRLKGVTQCAMLEDFGVFLALADGALFAYHIEALVPTSPNSQSQNHTPQRLSGNKDVQFFNVGQLAGRTLVMYMKKKGRESVFRVLEPIIDKINDPAQGGSASSRFGFGVQRSEWFRIYRQFSVGSEAFDLVFLESKVAILCTKGFEIMELADFKSVTIPQRDDPRFANVARRCDACRPLGMFRSNENELLLCYDEFGIYVNRSGDPTRTIGATVEWEGRAQKVAFHPPYIALFDTYFVEIRHIDKGNVVQIISGEDIRCVWDQRDAKITSVRTPGPEGWGDGTDSQESRIHCAMNAPDLPGQSKPVQYQHIFELVPTVPSLPSPPASPLASINFPRASSSSLPPLRTSVAGRGA